MTEPTRTRSRSLLIGIGLVLIGLLTGILAMLFVMQAQGPKGPAMPVVERVELGDPAAATPPPRADLPEVAVDPMKLNTLFKTVADRVKPTVVYIQVVARGDRDGGWFPGFENRLFGEPGRQSVGSGVLISNEGYIITNNHVIEGAGRIQVTLNDKRQYPAQVIGVDPSTDLAVIKVEGATEALPVIALGDSDGVEVGEWVLAVGNPFRLTSTVTAGIVSALGRQVRVIEGDFGIEDFIQTDAAINPGNSGGALVNLRGELVGISTAIATESGSYEGYGFAVPVNLMERVARDLIEFGEVERGYLGVQIGPVDAQMASDLELDRIGGVYLSEVSRWGAAYRAGLRPDDIIVSIDGRMIDAPNELQSTVARYRPGDVLQVEAWRGGDRRRFAVELIGREDPGYANWLAELEQQQAPPPQLELPEGHPEVDPEVEIFDFGGWGLGLQALTARERRRFRTEQGVYIAYVERGSVAAEAGLPRDVVVTNVAGRQVQSIEDAITAFQAAAAAEEAILIRARRRDGQVVFYELEIPALE